MTHYSNTHYATVPIPLHPTPPIATPDPSHNLISSPSSTPSPVNPFLSIVLHGTSTPAPRAARSAETTQPSNKTIPSQHQPPTSQIPESPFRQPDFSSTAAPASSRAN